MSSDEHVELSVTWGQVAAFRLSRHHLRERAPTHALVPVVGDMTGAQAQLLSAAQLSLWTRVRDLRVADIEAALNERALVKAACMRQTLFLVPSDLLAVFVRGSARRAEKEIRWARGIVCFGPNHGNETTLVRADAWIPQWQDAPREQAEDSLLRLYLRAHGPATATDFALWSGMTLTEAREIWRRGEAGHAPVDVDGWTAEVLREDLDELAQAGFEQSVVRLLPFFDSYLLGHKERNHLVVKEHRPRVFRAQGWIAPVVLVDGRAVAVWEHAWEGNSLRLKVSKFGSISQSIAAGIRKEAQDLGSFLGTSQVEIQVN